MTDPADLPAREARRLIGRRALSPVELTEACLARMDALDHAVNAVVARDGDGLRAAAREAEAAVMRGDPLGPLHGLPLAVKDMEDVAGLPTTYGSEIFARNVPERDDARVAPLRAAGAIPFCKTNVPEWSAGANTRNRVHGTTANPYGLDRSAAGSSGGSAVALALGYAPLATGSDMGGSLRTPAAFAGVVGFRPSPGVVPGGARAMALVPLSTHGPMARDVGDAALLLSAMAAPDGDDPWSVATGGRTAWGTGFDPLPHRDLASLRVAATPDFGFAPTSRAVQALFEAALARLAPHVPRLDHATPDCADADRIFAVLRALSFLAPFEAQMADHPELVGPHVAANVEEARGYSALDVSRALAAQGAYHRRWQAFFRDHDILVAPTATLQPPPWRLPAPVEIDGAALESYYHWLALAYASTNAGHPSVTIPCGADGDGLPFGLQVIGPRHEDRMLLAAAAEIEAVLAGVRPRPDLAALRAAPPLREAEGFMPT